ncbi:MAG: isoprenylcysteine carboxylmethyltransferase family protein [Chitinispirillaceae bacterium]|nr:isoprenylcysteine carboxylmethyltransferase family protein [Chitinispirillaceae bacterium]
MGLLSTVHLTNAWLLVVPVWLAGLLIASTNRQGMKRAADMSWYTRIDTIAAYAAMLLMFAFMAISLFIRLDRFSPLFWAGLVLVSAGFITNIASKITYANAGQGAAITKGIYHYSRNPMYASFSLVMAGTAIASRSLLLLAVWIIVAACTHWLIIGEERYCLTTYGDSYRDYMKKTPRYFLFL